MGPLRVAWAPLCLAVSAAANSGPPPDDSDLLVAMSGSGRIERYDCASGRWLGTFIYGIPHPNGLAWGPDGHLYVSTGALNSQGKVLRYDGWTGAFLGEFVAYPPEADGHLLRANGLAFHDGDLFVVGCDNGKIVRYDGVTAAWKGDFATVSPVSVTQIRFHKGFLYAADFRSESILRFDAATGEAVGPLTSLPGFAPWGLAIDAAGRVFWSGSDNTVRVLDGETNRVFAGGEGELRTPLWLEIGPDGRGDSEIRDRHHFAPGQGAGSGVGEAEWLPVPEFRDSLGNLYCSSWSGNSVEAWSLATGEHVLHIEGPEVRGPMGLAFTTYPVVERRLFVVGDTERQGPARKGDRAMVRIEAVSDAALVTHLGWDTEGGDRARHNLLRAPLELRVKLGETWHSAAEFPVKGRQADSRSVRYRFAIGPQAELVWGLESRNGRLSIRLALSGSGAQEVGEIELRFPFDPRLCATTVLSGEWTDDGSFTLPAVVSAPDLGQMLLTCPRYPSLRGRFVGNRAEQWIDLTLSLPGPDADGLTAEGVPKSGTGTIFGRGKVVSRGSEGENGYQSLSFGTVTIDFAPVRLPAPKGLKDASRWAAARRGWFNFLQVNAQPQGTGVWANNVISNPVSSTVFWLGDQVLLIPEAAPGVPLSPLLRRTIEFWLCDAIEPDGLIHYVETGHGSPMMDANPSVVIGAWCYVEASGDEAWLRKHIERLEFVARYVEQRDVDGDGLVESTQSGNRGTHAFGDTAWDTYSSGHKNAYVNALAYRAFRCLADLEGQLGRAEQQDHFTQLADRIKAVYQDTFYNPETGWLGWWRSEDGFLHDIYSDVVTDIAIMYGLVSPEDGRRMLDAYWQELERSGFERFDLGVPLNIRPVPRDDQCGEWGGKKEDGSDTFGKYLNGGCCVSNAYFLLVANYIAGDRERADRVLDAMLKRQAEGVFPNGGGFQNGVINRYPDGAEFFDWQGNTCGYEGHLVYSWMFLQAILLREPQFRERLLRPLVEADGG